MSLWGKYDAKAASGTGTIQVVAANSTAIGSSANLSTNFEVGDYLYVGNNWYVFTEIASEIYATVASANTGAALKSAQANGDYVVSEKPLFTTFAEAKNVADGNSNTVYGVSANEMSGSGGIGSITVTAAGAGYTVMPTAVIADANGSSATTSTRMKVITFTVGSVLDADAGTGYANGDVIKVNGGTGTSANATVTTGAANTSVASLAVVNAGLYSALPTLTGAATTAETGVGSGLKVDLSMGLASVLVTAAGSGYVSPTVTIANTGGAASSVATATAALTASERANVAHAGWVRRTVGTGGRAGRVQYETLVAMSTIGGDAEDDSKLPE